MTIRAVALARPASPLRRIQDEVRAARNKTTGASFQIGSISGVAKHDIYCDLDHARARRATVRLQMKSSRAQSPGHPMVRDVLLCKMHAQQLRGLGLELVDG
jgi:hypothetical protein